MSLKNMFDHLLGFNMSILTKKNTLAQRFTQITNVHKSLKNSTDSVFYNYAASAEDHLAAT